MRKYLINKSVVTKLAAVTLFSISVFAPTLSQAQSPSSGYTIAPASAASREVTTSGTGLRESPTKILAGAARSGAVTQTPGETYYGPGPMTVGYLGAKKQLVLPAGAWVLLSAEDRQSAHQQNPVPLVSLVFGQFQGGQLKSLMNYLFNGRAVAKARGWRDADDCITETLPANAARVQGEARSAKACGWTRRISQAPQVTDAGWEAGQNAAIKLGAPIPQGPVQLTRAWVQDTYNNYLSIRRADFSSETDQAVQHQIRSIWLASYLPMMLEGFDKLIAADELAPNPPGVVSARVKLPE